MANHLIPSRRTFLVAATAAAAVGAPVIADASEADPILAAIERLKIAEIELSAVCSEEGELEHVIPEDKRRTKYYAGKIDLVEADDKRWIAHEFRYRSASNAVDDRSCDLLDIQPTTVAGLVALLRYAYEYEALLGREWPQDVAGFGERDCSFSIALHLHAANTIERLCASTSGV